jgi:hypothetical protein
MPGRHNRYAPPDFPNRRPISLVPPSGEPILVRAESRVHRSDEFGRQLRRDMLHQKSYSQPSTTCSKNDFPTINLHVILILKVTAATAIQFRVIQLLTRYSQAVERSRCAECHREEREQ